MKEIEKLRNAAALIEEMTDGRQTLCVGVGGCHIRTSDDANFGLQIRASPILKQESYQITFEVYSRRMGTAMNSDAFMGLLEEAGQLHALMLALEMQTFHPGRQEYKEFCGELAQENNKPIMGQTF